jgi:hypothetical protein
MADNFDEPIGDASEEAAGRPVSESPPKHFEDVLSGV